MDRANGNEMNQASEKPAIPGYDFGTPNSAVSPLTDEELRQLEQTAGWTEQDARLLKRHADLFRRKAEEMVDSWRSVIGAQPHLAQWFAADGRPDEDYKASVKRRFVQWVVDVAVRPHDRNWLNYQEEIGLRHTPAKKNVTDNQNTPPLVRCAMCLLSYPWCCRFRNFLRMRLRISRSWVRWKIRGRGPCFYM